MEACKNFIPYKSYPWHGKVVLSLFIISGSILIGITTDLSNKVNFSCKGDRSVAADVTHTAFIQTSCLSKYEEIYDSPIPLHWYIILSFGLVLSLSLVYGVGVKSRIEKFDTSEPSTSDIELQPLQQSSPSGQRLNGMLRVAVFHIYIAQLLFARIIPTILFAGLVFFPAQYPTKFSCPWSSPLSNTTNSFSRHNFSFETVECTNLTGSKYKNSAMAVGMVNAICALLALLEATNLVRKVCGNKSFSCDREFCSVYLLGKSKEVHIIIDLYKTRLRANKDTFKMDIQYGPKGNLDQMHVPLIIQTGRKNEILEENTKRHQIYNTYLQVLDKSNLIHDIEELFENTENPPKKILVVGRPGIGKSILAKKLLFNWTKEACQFYKEKTVILFKFRYFNSELNKFKSLREILRIGIGLPAHDSNFDRFFKFVLANPEKVFLVFDGLDELKVDSDCFQVAEDTPDDYWEPMSVFSVWKKLISGKFLPGATVITTSRPTVDDIYSKLSFDVTLEILGFTKSEIHKYVQIFCSNREVESEKIWNYIKVSAELLSLCYIPVNNYIVCLTLERCEKSEANIPGTLTELYKRVVRVLLWDHHPSCKSIKKEKDFLNSNNYFPKEVIGLLDELKTLAVKGVENKQLIFKREDISGIKNCGLFNCLPNDDESQFYFLHLTLQEFLAAWKLVDGCDGPLDVENVLSKNLEEPRWHLVIQFFAGLLGDKIKKGKLTKDCYKCFSEHIPSNEKNWKGSRMREVLLMIKCLYELLDEEIIASTAGNVLCEKEYQITIAGTKTCRIAPADCKAFSQFLLYIKNLHVLDLSGHCFNGSGCLELINVFTGAGNELVEVSLNNNLIRDEGVKDLSLALKKENCKLTSIDLSENIITDKGVKELSEAFRNENCKLTSVDIAQNRITDEGVRDLCETLKNINCKLTSINLRENMITDEGLRGLSEALSGGKCDLTSVDLGGNDLTDKGVTKFSEALKNKNSKLTTINLALSTMTDKSVKDLSEALKHENSKLTIIDLSYNCITDQGFKYLSEALKNENCKLTCIDLYSNELTDECLKELGEALKNKNCKVTAIGLGDNMITDEGVKGLSEALKNENCKLDIVNTS